MSSPAVSRHRLVDRPRHPSSTLPSPPVPRVAGEDSSGTARITGRYRYDRCSGAWWWSADTFDPDGLAAGSAPPNTEGRLLAAISQACATGEDFALETRIVRADGEERDVVLVGECRSDDGGVVTAVEGLAIDITECHPPGSPADRAQALQAEVEQLRAAMVSRASIEQAKGILMLLTSCGDQVAFDLLAHISSHTHRKVRDVALVITESAAGRTQLPDDVRAIIRDACPPTQPLR